MQQCIVGKLVVMDHPTRPDLQIGTVAGNRVVVGRHYDNEILGIFIPEGAIIPDKLADEMWVRGRLSGKLRNRVKAREMGGVESHGLFYGSRYWIMENEQKKYLDGPSWNPAWVEGQDVTQEIGVTFRD